MGLDRGPAPLAFRAASGARTRRRRQRAARPGPSARYGAAVRTCLIVLSVVLLAAGCGSDDEGGPSRTGDTRTSSERGRLPADFIGVYSDDVFFRDAAYKRTELARQHETGIRLIRLPFAWDEFAARPERFDELMRAAAAAGIRVLPMLVGPEPGVERTSEGMRPPRDLNAYAAFVGAVARRFGENGSFWEENAELRALPIRSWQIWNEPNIRSWWSTGPDPSAYAKLLAAGADAIREVDPDAEIVAAGLPDSRLGIPAARFLAAMYRAGAAETFDVAAIHPYAATPREILAKVRKLRRVIEDNSPIWVTEFGWGTGGRAGPLRVDPERQARYVTETLLNLVAARRSLRLRGAVYFQWRDPEPYPGRPEIWPFFAGLTGTDGRAKPALAALERVVARLDG